MASNVIRATLLADAQRFKAGFREGEQATQSFEQKSGKGLSDFAKVAVTALAVKALGAVKEFVGSSKDAFVDLNESLNALEVTYGDSADGIKKLGEGAADSLGLSNSEFNAFAVQMSAFAQQIAGDGGDVVGVVDELSTRVSDFASVMNLEVGEAARLFQSGLAGETEPLRKYGIDLSAAAVNAHALAVGIGSGSGELSEQEKVLARHSLLMAATDKTAGDFANTSDELANATRIANAQIENNQALVGQALVGAYQAAIPVTVSLSAAAADVAVRFLEMTGEMDAATGALKRWELENGEATDSITNIGKAAAEANPEFSAGADLIDVWTGSQEKMNEVFAEGIAQLDLTTGTVREHRNEVKMLADELGLTEEQEAEFIRIMEAEVVAQTNAGRSAAQHRGRVEELGSGIDDTTGKVEEATTALEEFEAEVRSQTEPLYALMDAEDDVAEAMQAVIDTETEFGKESPEWQKATRDLARANDALVSAQLAVAEQSGLTRSEFNTHLQQMGNMSQEQIDYILGQFDRANNYNWREQVVTVRVRGKDVPVGFGLPRAARGGRIDGPTIVGEEGEEVFVPDGPGTIIPNHQLQGGRAAVQPIIINIHGSIVTERDLVDAIHQGLLQKQRRTGGLGLT